MSEVMSSSVESKKGFVGDGALVLTALFASTTMAIAGGDNNTNGTSFSENFSSKYEKCGNYTKNKCVEVSPEFTFFGDQDIDIDFFDKNDIIGNNGNIILIDNGYTVNIVDGAMAEKAVFGKEVKKIFKDKDGKLVIENKNGEKKYYTIEKVKNGMTNLKEYSKVTFSVDGKIFQSIDEMDKVIKTLDLGGKEGEIIEIDNEKGEVYNLYYNGKIIPLGFLDFKTKEIILTNEGKLIIKDKSINGKIGETTIFQLSKNLKGEILTKQIKREFVYKK